MERRELIQELSEEECNHTSKTRSTYHPSTSSCQADRLHPHNLIILDKAHCQKVAREAIVTRSSSDSSVPWVAIHKCTPR